MSINKYFDDTKKLVKSQDYIFAKLYEEQICKISKKGAWSNGVYSVCSRSMAV